jgi:hypothetical protein
MPPIKKTAPPRKLAPRKSTVPPTPVEPTAGSDDFLEWQDKQPVPGLEIEREEGDDFSSGDESEAIERARVAERAPKIPSPTRVKAKSLGDRFRAALKGEPAKRGPGRPKTTQPRVSVESVITGAWMLAAQAMKNANAPVARVLMLQAPIAGHVLEEPVKGTAIDKMLQPLARASKGGEVAFALLMPPILVGALTTERGAAQADMLTPILRRSLMSWMKLAGPKLMEMAEEEAKFEQEYGAQVDAMITYLITGVMPGAAADSPNGSHRPDGVPTTQTYSG